MSIANTYVAYRFLRLLTTPFEKTDAFKLGGIDADGKLLKTKKERKTSNEKKSYDTFHRLVFNLKRVLHKIPFMKGRLGSLAAALYLIREHLEHEGHLIVETELEDIFCQYLRENRIISQDDYEEFVEEYVSNYMLLTEDAPANAVGSAPGNVAGLHGDPPVKKKKRKKYSGIDVFEVDSDIIKGMKFKIKSAKNIINSIKNQKLRKEIQDYKKKNPKHPIILSDKSGVMLFIRR